MTAMIVKIKHRLPWLWRPVEMVNSLLCKMLLPDVRGVAAHMIERMQTIAGYRWSVVTPEDAGKLVVFFECQPEEHLAYFAPHRFDVKTLRRMASDSGFLMMMVTDATSGRVAGYHFMRLFFTGRCFHGLIVDPADTGHGIGTKMWRLSGDTAVLSNLRLQATISKDNLASLASCRKALEVVRETPLADGYLLLDLKSPLLDEMTALSERLEAQRKKRMQNCETEKQAAGE